MNYNQHPGMNYGQQPPMGYNQTPSMPPNHMTYAPAAYRQPPYMGSSQAPTYIQAPGPVATVSRPITPAPSPGDITPEEEDRVRLNTPGPEPVKHTYDGKVWQLLVVQQPIRARMCGFGERDRRPVSPPPIVKLIITDAVTGAEIDYKAGPNVHGIVLSQLMCFATAMDLSGEIEKSTLRGSTQQQVISAATSGGFPTRHATQNPLYTPTRLDQNGCPVEQHSYATGPYANSTTGGGSAFPRVPAPPQGNAIPGAFYPIATPYGAPRGTLPLPQGMGMDHRRPVDPPTPPLERDGNGGPAVAKNLIGQTATTAQLLNDHETGEPGIFFIFADLSIRSEEWFRLRFCVNDISPLLGKFSETDIMAMAAENNAAPSTLDTGKRGSKSTEGSRDSLVAKQGPCVAKVWTTAFRVYSAKKFPGVADATEISKCFVEQGVKISIRKEKGDGPEAKKRKRKGTDDSDDDQDDFDDAE